MSPAVDRPTGVNEPPDWLATAPTLPPPDGSPVHATVSRWLLDLVARGELVAGDRLPREDEFAATLGISRMTLRQALSTLEAGGLLDRRTGRRGGTVVREPRIDCDLTGLAGFTEQMRRAHVRAGARVISAATIPAGGAAARGLGVARKAPVHEIVRVRTARGEPLAIERSYFPGDTFPDLLAQRLTGSLYALLSRRYGQRPVSATEVLEPVTGRPDEVALLEIPASSPLMLVERTAFTETGLAVEFARDLFRPDRVRITMRTGMAPTVSPR